MSGSVKIFLSTVSDEFRAYRDQLRSDLTRHNVEVKAQEDFKDLGGDTLDKLDVYVENCDAVVHLVGDMTGSAPQESPHFESGLISALFGPQVGRTGSPKTPHWAWRDLFLDDCETRTRTSGLVIRDSSHRNTNFRLHFGLRKNEGIAEDRRRLTATLTRCSPSIAISPPKP